MTDFDAVSAALKPRMAQRNAGFWCPDGWLDLVVEMDTHLQACPEYRIVQVKEKFGQLCFYASGLTTEEQQYVRDMEVRSLTVCQGCGSIEGVKMRHAGWVATMCGRCWQQAQCPRSRGYGVDRDCLPTCVCQRTEPAE